MLTGQTARRRRDFAGAVKFYTECLCAASFRAQQQKECVSKCAFLKGGDRTRSRFCEACVCVCHREHTLSLSRVLRTARRGVSLLENAPLGKRDFVGSCLALHPRHFRALFDRAFAYDALGALPEAHHTENNPVAASPVFSSSCVKTTWSRPRQDARSRVSKGRFEVCLFSRKVSQKPWVSLFRRPSRTTLRRSTWTRVTRSRGTTGASRASGNASSTQHSPETPSSSLTVGVAREIVRENRSLEALA